MTQGINGCELAGYALGGYVYVIGAPRGDLPLADFVRLQRAEDRLIKIEILV